MNRLLRLMYADPFPRLPRLAALLRRSSPVGPRLLRQNRISRSRRRGSPAEVLYFSQPLYRAGPNAREEQMFMFNSMLRAGVIEAEQSPWVSPVVFVPNVDVSWIFCVNFRPLNAIIFKDVYYVPRMNQYNEYL